MDEKNGHWVTLENGNKLFIEDGKSFEESLQDAFGTDSNYEKDLPKKREYKTYWLYDTTKEDYENGIHGAHGVSKYEYDKAIAAGKEGYTEEFGKSYWRTIPDDAEEKMQNAINSITSINSWNDFRNQIKKSVWGNGINTDNFDVIMDAFNEELNNKYNQLIQPKIDAINKIDIDNSFEIFSNKVNEMQLSSEFKQSLNNMFDDCKDENIKIMIATSVGELGLGIEKDGVNIYGEKFETTCYSPTDGIINFVDGNLDTESLAHETYHFIYERYNVNKSGLKETLKEEFNKNVLKQIEDDFGVAIYYKDNENVQKLIQDSKQSRIEKDRAYREMKIIDKEYEKIHKEFNELRLRFRDTSHLEEQYEEIGRKLTEATNDYNFKNNRYINKNYMLKNYKDIAATNFRRKYPNLADMIEGTQISIVDSTPFGFGHGKSYWKDDDDLQSNEFFAEMADLIATGDKEQYELIRKYIPKSVSKFEEVYDSINKDKGKVLKR